MAQETIYKSGFLRVLLVVFGSVKYILLQWLKLNAPHEKIVEAHGVVLDAVIEHGIKDLGGDTHLATGGLPEETKVWWAKKQIPNLKNAGVENIVTIIPDPDSKDKALKKLFNKDWEKSTDEGGIDIHSSYEKDILTKMQQLALKRRNKK